MILRKIEDLHNWASDTHYVWFPFLWLKLKPDVKMTFTHTLKMTFLFGPYFALYNMVRLALFGSHLQFRDFELSVVKFTVFFFFWFNFVTSYFWNRRVYRLKESHV